MKFVLLRLAIPLCLSLAVPVNDLLALPNLADPEGEGTVYTDPSAVDDDYHLQGEYLGWQRSSRWGRDTRSAGLQVIALGNGTFAATGYLGGLPGQGWFGGTRDLFQGTRQGDVAELEGDQYRLIVDGEMATLFTQDGTTVGEYHKVYRVSPTMGAVPPRGATILFDGTDTGHFVDAAISEDGLLRCGTKTALAFADFRMHAEFRLPYKPLGRGQDRGNSGLYLQSRYEVQILDTFGLEGVENECGALYKTRRPDVNMCFPPLVWQTYDIDFAPPRFDAQGNKIRDMRISVWHNGVPVHANAAIPHKTGAGRPEGPDPLPTLIQDHDNPVVFRNIWLIDRSSTTERRQAAVATRIATPVGQ